MALARIKDYNWKNGKDKPEFIKAVHKYALKLKVPADWLMLLMYSESSLDPTIINKWGYTGLIQFGEAARKQLNVTQKELVDMGGAKQMKYVYLYLVNYTKHGLVKDWTDLYLVVFYPNAGGTLGGTLKKPETWKFPDPVSKNNPGIFTNKDIGFDDNSNTISIKSFKKWANVKIGNDFYSPVQQRTIEKVKPKPKPEPVKSELGYIIYVHNYSDITDLDVLIKYKRWFKPGGGSEPTGDELMNYKDNKEQLRLALTKRNSRDTPDAQLKTSLVVGARLKIPISWIEPAFLAFDGSQNVFPNADIETFISDAMLKATASPEYRTGFAGGAKGGVVKKMIPKPRGWIWCKSLGIENNGNGDPNIPKFSASGAVFDLSPFITNLSVSTGGAAGTFSFSLPPLICECTPKGWIIKKDSTKEFINRDGTNERGFVSKGHINYQTETNELRRSKFLFHQMISTNDIVWISLDNPQTEPIGGLASFGSKYSINNPKVEVSDIPNRYWDMIGLVDTNHQSYSAPNVSVGININGRDCMKLLIEESSYYLTLPDEREKAAQTEGLFVNDNPENWGRPARVSSINMTSKIFNLQISAARTVGEMMSFIISSMAAIEIAPDKLFEGYQAQERSGKGFGISKYESYDLKSNTTQTFKAAGIWQIIKLQIDNYAVNDRTVIENRLAVHSGSLVNAMKLFADGRFIEFFGDTYVDQFFIMVRRPPYNKKCVFDYLTKITGANPGGPTFELDVSERKANTPQTLKKSDEFIEGQNVGGIKDNGQSIDDCMVVSENINWYNGEVYSWYRINLPQAAADQKMWASELYPVIFFREYCEIWGNKALDVQSNYIPWNKIPLKSSTKVMQTTFMTQLYEDLAYLIETNAYLPFTRSGSITMKGDRRIKAKTWIRYIPTGEVFYVDKVTNNYSITDTKIERTTTLNVSRGMVEYNSSGQHILPLYFKIIDGLPNQDGQPEEKIKEEIYDERILNVYFDFDMDVLIVPVRIDLENEDLINDPEKRLELYRMGEESLTDLLLELLNNPGLFARITGHTDENGTIIYNEDLSRRRANRIKGELVERYARETGGDDIQVKAFSDRLSTFGMGETMPLKTQVGIYGDERRLVD